MTLREYLLQHKITSKLIASTANVGLATITRARCGQTISPQSAKLILRTIHRSDIEIKTNPCGAPKGNSNASKHNRYIKRYSSKAASVKANGSPSRS